MRFFWQDNSSYEVGQNFEWRLQSSSTYTQESVLGLEYYEKEFAEENVYCARITNWWNGNNSIPEEQGSYSVGYSSEKCFVAMASPSPLIAEVINIGGSDAIKLTWQDSSTQETGFTIEVNTGSGWGLLTTKAPNSTTHVHSSGLVAGTTYCYRVRAERTGFGSSPWSNSTCVRFGSPACSTIWGPIDLSGGIGGSITTSAVIDDSSVYVGTSTGYLISVDVMNGQIRWLKNLGSAVSSHLCASQEGQRTTIFVGTLDGKFHAVDSDGNLIGTQDLGGVVGGCAVKDGKVYLGTTTGWVFVLSKTLSILNSKQVSGAISTAPAIDAIRGSVYFVTESGKVYAFSLDLSDKWSITLTGAPVIRSSPGLGPKGDIYFGANDGKLYKVSPSGSVVWSYNIGSAIRSSPVIYTYGSQVTVFVGADNNYVYAISENITGTSASLLWSYSTGSAVRSSGALSQKSVFAGSGSTLYSISIGGGSLSCSVAVLGSITAPVKMKGQIVFLGTGGGRLYAISSVEPQSSYSWGDFGNGNGRILDAHPYRGFAVEKSSWPVSLGTGVGAEIWASPKLYDFDGDGKLEIVIATRGGQVYVLNSDGTVKTGWPKSTGNAIFGTSAIGDIDGDGLAEIVVGNDGGLVYAFDSAGNVKTGFPISVTCKVRFITLANIDSDPENEILFTALNPCNRIYAYDGNGTLKWYYEPGQLMASYPVVNGSGTSAEILITDTNGNVYKLNSSGNLISGWPINLGLSQWLSSPSVGDIDKDGTRDFVVGTTNPVTIYAYTLGGTSKWSLVLQDENGNNLIGYYPRHIVLADIDGDSNLEVIVTVLPYSSGNPGYIYVIDDNGVRMWFKKFSSSPSLAPLVGDFDYDGSQEIAVLTDKGWLYIFESDGTQAQGSPHFLGNNLVGFASLVFGDIDGDGRLDVVFGDKNGYVRVFELGKGTVNGKKEWYFRKNLRNNANYDEND
jgi:outer membrane protein assembly factor BamB